MLTVRLYECLVDLYNLVVKTEKLGDVDGILCSRKIHNEKLHSVNNSF